MVTGAPVTCTNRGAASHSFPFGNSSIEPSRCYSQSVCFKGHISVEASARRRRRTRNASEITVRHRSFHPVAAETRQTRYANCSTLKWTEERVVKKQPRDDAPRPGSVAAALRSPHRRASKRIVDALTLRHRVTVARRSPQRQSIVPRVFTFEGDRRQPRSKQSARRTVTHPRRGSSGRNG